MRARLLAFALAALLAPAQRAHAAEPAANAPCACPAPSAESEGTGGEQTIDINKADESALLKLPGIGPARARAIVAYRSAHGGFRNLSQLLHIKGIGRSLLRQLRPLLTVSDPHA
jgi:competence protein ComEA